MPGTGLSFDPYGILVSVCLIPSDGNLKFF
jgi:hypothetical protein